ncbi:thiamine biosynthesis lipoprotein [Allochromatium warmingii]|uniref:FAD:protein FMN transferase n=1 Tax=Allochromatium warmingii TaxID=61595 RepID=A0A1H3IEZ7_ALLWA|nr:FAD:protein FMN transferase [Allochromatium warmingii]SDY26300.1 thiamine biosynthesis lipoprotein [Allochromatium warmingii]
MGVLLSRPRPLALLLLLALVSLTLTACRDKAPVVLTQFTAFDTQVDVNLIAVTRQQAEHAAALVKQDFAYLDRDWSHHGEAMTRVNRLLATGQPFVPPPSVLRLVRLAQRLEAESDGLLNLANGALLRLWGFDAAEITPRPPPTEAQLAALLAAAPSLAALELQGLTLQARAPNLQLDLTPLARSQAIDLAMQHLQELGVRHALIQVGSGELRALGERSGQPWRIPVRRPSGSAVLAIMALRGDEALVTVNEQERVFTYRNQRYHAILDPRTGRPATGARSVTVMSTEATRAAAAARAIFIAGATRWREVAGRFGVQHVLLVDADGGLHLTPAMAARLERVDAAEQVELAEPERPSEMPPNPQP